MTNEILARTQPTILDLMIALAGGGPQVPLPQYHLACQWPWWVLPLQQP